MALSKDQYETRKAVAIAYLGGRCVVCGSRDDLEFDHIDPKSKRSEITDLLNSRGRLGAELDKCQLLCRVHHEEKSVRERGQELARGTHGTLSAYRYCKCDACRQAHSDWLKQYRQNGRTDRPNRGALA